MTDTKDTTEAAPSATPPATEPTAPTPSATEPSAPTPAATEPAAKDSAATDPAAPPGRPIDVIRSRIGVVVVVALMGVGVYWSRMGHLPFVSRSSGGRENGGAHFTRRPGPRDAAARPIRPEELALFAPLAAGSTLGPSTVTAINGMRDGYLSVNVRIGSTPLTIYVTRVTGRETGRFSYYFMGGSTSAIEATLTELRRVMSAHNDVPVPPDLRPFEGW
jgi:hypothetical protein